MLGDKEMCKAPCAAHGTGRQPVLRAKGRRGAAYFCYRGVAPSNRTAGNTYVHPTHRKTVRRLQQFTGNTVHSSGYFYIMAGGEVAGQRGLSKRRRGTWRG